MRYFYLFCSYFLSYDFTQYTFDIKYQLHTATENQRRYVIKNPSLFSPKHPGILINIDFSPLPVPYQTIYAGKHWHYGR